MPFDKSQAITWVNIDPDLCRHWRHRSGSILTQVMACCLMDTSHYMNQCWLFTCEVSWYSSESNFTQRAYATTHILYNNELANYIRWPVRLSEPMITHFFAIWCWHEWCLITIGAVLILSLKCFPHHWPFVRAIHRSPSGFPSHTKGQWCRALTFSLLFAWTMCWTNSGIVSDLRCIDVHETSL